jgi:hypothetical protein
MSGQMWRVAGRRIGLPGTVNRGHSWHSARVVFLVLLVAVSVPAWAAGGPGRDRDYIPLQVPHQASHAVSAARWPAQAELTGQLEALLGQHSVLAADMMRGRLRGDPDFAQAANAALGKNTDEIGRLVGSLLGERAQRRFTSLWAAHVVALFNYARGLADRDESVRGEARTVLSSYESDLADFFADASDGRLTRDAAEAAMRTHVEHLLQQADAYAAGDYATAYRLYREGYSHTFELGRTLATALRIPGGSSPGPPTVRLRSELSRLLGEHVTLVVTAMRAGAADTPDFAAAGDAVNGNTRDLTEAVDSLFGTPAAAEFQSLWTDHITALMTYTAGVAANDSRRRADASEMLESFEEKFASFLSTATQGRLDSPELARALVAHDRMLVEQVNAYVAKNYQQAHDITYSTYQDMFHLAEQLATAIGATVAARMPRGGTTAGGGGMAAVVEQR